MDVKRKLKPGEPGTLRHVQQYGDNLICVRYRYDKTTHKRQTTVEIIVDEKPWYGSIIQSSKPLAPSKKTADVYLKINYNETDLRARVKEAGGLWNVEKRLWLIARSKAKQLGLLDRIVGNENV
jgi:hypothetical protein